MSLHSLLNIRNTAMEWNLPFHETVCRLDSQENERSEADTRKGVLRFFREMLNSYHAYDPNLRSKSGLSGGGAHAVKLYKESGSSFFSPRLLSVIETALRFGESNACMKKIVAAPTAGACGVLPAVLIPLYLEEGLSEDQMVDALLTAAGIGEVIAHRASIAGASGGCQAEVGSASAMAAGALVTLKGGEADAVLSAVAFAIQNLLGLVCDPVAGLVEVPCVKRNVIGAMNAISASEMALAGLRNPLPADEVLDAMDAIGRNLPETLRETGLGGLAACPTGRRIREMQEKLNPRWEMRTEE